MLLTEMTQAKQCHRSLSKYSKPHPGANAPTVSHLKTGGLGLVTNQVT